MANELIPMDDMGVFADKHDTAKVNSLYVAEYFEKSHKHVIRDITKITEPKSGLSEQFIKANYTKSNYKDASGKKNPCYLMSRDGFVMLVMGYTGTKAMKFKEAYMKRFNEMEEQIKALVSSRHDFPTLTRYIAAIYENPQPYHYSNECNMINKIVTGLSTKQFRIEYNIPKGESIRPHLTKEQIELLDYLQKVDIGLMISVPDYHQRKRHLEWAANNMFKALKG